MPHHQHEACSAGWTRRRTLAALATIPAFAVTLSAKPNLLPAELTEICLRTVARAPQDQLGLAAAAGRSLPEIAASLRARLGPNAAEDWHAALVESGQRDIAQGDIVEILGHPLMHTEAEVFALGVRIRMGA